MKTSHDQTSVLKMGLIGCGIDYSLSPKLFNSNVLQEIVPSTFNLINLKSPQDWNIFWQTQALDYNYLCVTTPWKNKILDLPLTSLSPEVSTTRIANWIKIEDGKLNAFNTDYFAFKKWWLNLPKNLPQEIYYLGNGASSYSFLGMLKDFIQENPDYQPNLYIVTRDVKTFKRDGCHDFLKPKCLSYSELYQKKLNHHCLIINGSFFGQKEEMPLELIKILEQTLVWDLNYAKPYHYLSFYQKNGFEFLVNQALLFLAMQNKIDDTFFHLHQTDLIKSLSQSSLS